MFNIKSATTYNEMLGKLNKATFFSTLFFLIALRYLDFIPLIKVDQSLIPPLKDYKEIIEWSISFGIVPLFGAIIAWFLSHTFEVHNLLSRVLFLRHVWDKYFIVRTMLNRSYSKRSLKELNISEAMNELYYPEVKNIDQHYVLMQIS